MGNELPAKANSSNSTFSLWLKYFFFFRFCFSIFFSFLKLMESSSNYEKCLTSKLVRYDWSRCRTSRWKSSRETLTMKRSLLHIREVHFIHQWIVVIRLISCCLFLHFHAWSTVYHLQSRVSFIALKLFFFFLALSYSRLDDSLLQRYTKKGQKSKKIIGLIILYACRECFSTHARR